MRTAKNRKPLLIPIPGGEDQPRAQELRALPPTDPVELAGKYQVIFDQATDAILTVLENGTIDAANQAMEEISGYMKSELQGVSFEILSTERAEKKLPERARPLSADMFVSQGTYEDVAIFRKDGYIRLVDLSVRVVSTGSTRLAVALFRDVTEKKRMERELITKHNELRNAYYELEKTHTELKAMQETLVQSGKMAALGELAAGIAHELNQPLMGIRGYTQEIQEVIMPALKGMKDEAVASASLKEIITAVDKMSSIIGYLRTWVGKSTEKYEMTDIRTVVDDAFKLMSRQLAVRGIEVKRDFQADLPKVYSNPLQLEQVFINLASNARDAIDSTGRGKGTISVMARDSGAFVEVRFKDDGIGMTEKTRTKIFNPFFTTKEVGKGMGLGLSLSYGILSKFQGSIVVESEFGKGATFIIRIPKDFRELA